MIDTTMSRPLIYLAIFSAFAWSCLISTAYFLPPTSQDQQIIPLYALIIITLLYLAITLTSSTVISIVKAMLPNRKLPHLLIRDSFVLGAIVGLGCTGLIVLQLLRAATLLNVCAWLAIIGTVLWIRQSISSNAVDQPIPPASKTFRRRTGLGKAFSRKK